LNRLRKLNRRSRDENTCLRLARALMVFEKIIKPAGHFPYCLKLRRSDSITAQVNGLGKGIAMDAKP
jgi:hypothetical protein